MSVLLISVLPVTNEWMHLLVPVWGSKLNYAGVGWSWVRVWSSRNGPGDRTRKFLCIRDELKGSTSRAWRKQSCCDLCRKFKPPPAQGRGAQRRTARLCRAYGFLVVVGAGGASWGASNLSASVWGWRWGGMRGAHECDQVPVLLLLSCHSASLSLILHICEMGREYNYTRFYTFITKAEGHMRSNCLPLRSCSEIF